VNATPPPPERLRQAAWRALGLAVVLAALVALLTHGRWWHWPDRHNPFAPLVVADEPNWLTRFKLDRLSDEPAACRAVLHAAGVAATPVADHDAGAGCGWAGAVRLRGGAHIGVGPPLVLTCRAAVSFALWERHVVQPAASRHFGRPVQRIEHFGSYACRNVGHAASGRRSRHASADALDIAGFVLDGGARVSVARDWGGDAAAAAFLADVHAGACRHFDGVLGPADDRAHADHFHLERGGWRTCR
jgi:hypothetical protein